MTNIFFLCGIVVVFISISFEQFFSFLCVYCDCKKKYFYFGLWHSHTMIVTPLFAGERPLEGARQTEI